MKRGKDEEKMMGPMFPRLHVNDTEKGGPRAPPRNKMALYEQLSIPAQRFSHGGHTANNNTANSLPPLSEGGGNERGVFLSHQMSPRHNEKKFSQYTDLNTPLDQVEQRKKLDEDDYRVPIFIHSVPSQECPKYTNGTVREKLSCSSQSSFNHSLKFQQNQDKNMLEHDISADLEENIAVNKRNFSSLRALAEEEQNIVDDLSNDSELNLERANSVSETSIVDSISGPDITPDDVVGIIGQKHFWKARRAIANQQSVFAVQLFELHRLIKVQKLAAASPHLVLEVSAYSDKPTKPSPKKKLQLDYTIKAIPNISKQQPAPEKPSHKNEGSAENTPNKRSTPLIKGPPPPSNGNDHNPAPWCFNQPQGHHWLIPVMSPSEGLVYKPYSGPGFVGHPCGPPVPSPVMGNFIIPGYGPPPSYPPPGPHSYFPHYGMPMMNTPAFSGSSVEQMNPPAAPGHFSAGGAHFTKNGSVPDTLGSHGHEDIEVQASTGSRQSERKRDRAADERNMLPFFPTSPVKDSHNKGPQIAGSDQPGPIRVIRVVPYNARTASESAARIFLSIQEERKHNDSV